jgi:predicted RNA polymerase sigma factor
LKTIESTALNISQLTEHLFRKEAGKMVSILTNIFGPSNLQLAEDIVQDTLLQAFKTWKLKGIPDNPEAWLYRAAKNKAMDELRKNKHSDIFDFTASERQLLK